MGARHMDMRPLVAFCILLPLLFMCTGVSADDVHSDSVHIAFLTDCSRYSDWQSVGMTFSYKQTKQPGQITRIMCCEEAQQKTYNQELLSMMPTHVAPSFAYNKELDDHYAAYNKPGAVVDWLAHVTPKEDWILVLDSDMLMLKSFSPKEYNVSKGWVVSADYRYLIGVMNDLYKGHIPEVEGRKDKLAGPEGRHADQVGGFFLVHRDDLSRYAPLWLKITADVRNDSNAWKWSGDQYVEKGGRPWISEMYGYVYSAAKMNVWHKWSLTTMHYPTYIPAGDVYAIHPGDKPWISEMYGYAFGAATGGVWHHWDPISMIYPQYEPSGVPKLMHYGLLFEVGDYKFDKHWHYDFDVTKCPPWVFGDKGRSTAGVFPPPPHPSKLTNQKKPTEYYRDLLSIETVATLNAGFCDYHLRHCPPTKQLLDVCTEAVQLYIDNNKAIDKIESEFKCSDRHVKCGEWAKKGECATNTDYMKENCAKACGECHSLSEDAPRPEPLETLLLLAKLKDTLAVHDTAATTTTATKGDPDAKATGKAADPDSSRATPLPHTEVKAASPPPPSPPPPHPSPAVVHRAANVLRGSQQAQSGKTRKDLLIRCYRMPLSSAEVKACAAAANRGEEWVNPGAATAPKTGSTLDTGGSDTSVDDAGVIEIKDSRNGRSVSDHDHEDLRQLEELTDPPKAQSKGVKSLLLGLSTWQAVLLWAVVLVAVLVAVPRFLKMRRRQRSGMRSE